MGENLCESIAPAQRLISTNTFWMGPYNSAMKANNPILKWAKDLKGRFSKENVQVTLKRQKRWSTSLTTVIIFKNPENKTCVSIYETGTLMHC